MRHPRIDFAFYFTCLLILTSSTNFLLHLHAQPQVVGGAAFARIGNNFYIQGGASSGDNLLSAFWSLDLTKSWTTSNPAWTSLPTGPLNGYHAAGYSSDNNSFITFGRDIGAAPTLVTNSWVNLYDIPSRTWSFQANPSNVSDTSRRDFSVVTNPSANKIYILGGDSSVGGTKSNNVFDTFDPITRTITEVNTPVPGPQNISTFSAVWVPRLNAMMVIGGQLESGSATGLYFYHPNTRAWTIQPTTGPFTYSRTSPCAASNVDGSLVAVHGGFLPNSANGDPYVYVLNTTSWIWTRTPSSGRGRGNAACAIVDDTFIVWGGFYNYPNTANGVPMGSEALLLFSISTQRWKTTYTPSAALAGTNTTSGGGSGGGGSGGILSNGTSSSVSGTDSDSAGLSAGAIGGIAAGAVVLIALLVFALIVWRKRSRHENEPPGDNTSNLDGEYPAPDMLERRNQAVPKRPPPPKLNSRFQSYSTASEGLLGPRRSLEGGNNYNRFSDPTTPTSLQFLPGSESGSEYGNSVSQGSHHAISGAVYYPPPPVIQQQQQQPQMLPKFSSPYEYQSDISPDRRSHDPHSLIGAEGYYPYSSSTVFDPTISSDQYHDTYGMKDTTFVAKDTYGAKHMSVISSQTGYSDVSSTFPQGVFYDPRMSSPPPVPRRPVSGPQGGLGFGSVDQTAPGAPQAVLNNKAQPIATDE